MMNKKCKEKLYSLAESWGAMDSYLKWGIIAVIVGLPAIIIVVTHAYQVAVVCKVIFCFLILILFPTALIFIGEMFSYKSKKEKKMQEQERERAKTETDRKNKLEKARRNACFKVLTEEDKAKIDKIVHEVYLLLKDYDVRNLYVDETVPLYVVYHEIFEEGFFQIKALNHNRQSFTISISKNKDGKLSIIDCGGLNAKSQEQKDFERSYQEQKEAAAHVKKPNPNIAKARAKRKAKKNNAAAKDAGIFIDKKGQQQVSPDWNLVAKEWVSINVGYLNKILCAQMQKQTGDVVKTIVPIEKLPEKQAWNVIGKILKGNDEIDAFSVTNSGLELIIKR